MSCQNCEIPWSSPSLCMRTSRGRVDKHDVEGCAIRGGGKAVILAIRPFNNSTLTYATHKTQIGKVAFPHFYCGIWLSWGGGGGNGGLMLGDPR